jgi:hypothetical protein
MHFSFITSCCLCWYRVSSIIQSFLVMLASCIFWSSKLPSCGRFRMSVKFINFLNVLQVTVERDLHIRRLFDDIPLIWHLMSLVAMYRPALCYCSVLLRALIATLLAQWGSAAQRVQHSDRLLATTTQVLELMALGQLLPPPLSSLRDVIPHLQPQEVCFETIKFIYIWHMNGVLEEKYIYIYVCTLDITV